MSAGQAISRSPYKASYSAGPPRTLQGDARHRQEQIYGPPEVSNGGRFFGRHQPYAPEYRSSQFSSRGHADMAPGIGMMHGDLGGRLALPQVPPHYARYHETNVFERRDGNNSPADGARMPAPFESPCRPVARTHSTLAGTREFASFASPAHPAVQVPKRNQPAGEATFPADEKKRDTRTTGASGQASAYSATPEMRPYPPYYPLGPTGPAPAADLPPRVLELSFSGHAPTGRRHPSNQHFPSSIGHQLGEERMRSPEGGMPPLSAPERTRSPEEGIPPLPAPEKMRAPEDGMPPLPAPERMRAPDEVVPPLPAPKRSRPTEDSMAPLPKLPVLPQECQQPVLVGLCNETFAPRPLGMPSDSKYLTEFHCFLRRNLIEVFCANENDINAPRRGRKKPVMPGQVGIRCMPCACLPEKRNGAVYYPTSLASIYNSVMLIQQRHFSECAGVSSELREEYTRLKQILGRSGAAKDYWEDAARKMGLFDTPDGIRYFSPGAAAGAAPSPEANKEEPSDLLVQPNDKNLATEYSFLLMSQMKSCTFAESDRLGKRRSQRVGFPGIACIHCYSANGSGRYFPSSIKTFADVSKTMNVLHNHLIRCKCCPQPIKTKLESLKQIHHTEKESMAHGSQKSFFDIVWSRLHHTSGSPSSSQLSIEEVKDSSPESFNSWNGDTTANNVDAGEGGAANLPFATPGGRHAKESAAHTTSINDIALIMTSLSKAPVVWDDWSKKVKIHQV